MVSLALQEKNKETSLGITPQECIDKFWNVILSKDLCIMHSDFNSVFKQLLYNSQ